MKTPPEHQSASLTWLDDDKRPRRYFPRNARLPFMETSAVGAHHDLLVLNQHEEITDDPSLRDRFTIFNVDFP